MNKNDILRLTEAAREGRLSFEDYVANINLFTEDASMQQLYSIYLPGFKSEEEAPLELMSVLEYAKKVTRDNQEKYFDLVEQVLDRDTARFNAYAPVMLDLFEEGCASVYHPTMNDDVYEGAAAEFNRVGNMVYGESEPALMTEAIRLGPITISKTVKSVGELSKLIGRLGRNTALLESKDATAVRAKLKTYESLVATDTFVPLKDLKKMHKSYDEAKKELRKVPKFNAEKGDTFTCYIWYKGNQKFCGISFVENKGKYNIKPEVFGGMNSSLKSYYNAAMALSCSIWTADARKCLIDLRKNMEKGWQVQKNVVKESVSKYFDNPEAIASIHNYYRMACENGMILEADLNVYDKLIDNMYKEAAEEKEKEKDEDDDNGDSDSDDTSKSSSDDDSSDDSSSEKQPTKNQKEKLDDAVDEVKDLTDDASKSNLDKAKDIIQDTLDELKIKSQDSIDTCKDYFVNAIGGDDLDSKWTDLCDELFVVPDDDSDDDDKKSSKDDDSDSDDDSSDDSDDSSDDEGDDTEESVFDFYGDFDF